MTKQKSDSRLTIHAYLQAIERVETQFAIIRFALKSLSPAKIRGFYKAQLQAQVSTIESGFKMLKEHSPEQDFDGLKEMMFEHLRKKHRMDNRRADIRFKIEFSEDRINQSELLLLVAHFESFLKEVHRTFLIADPGKVFSNRDTKVMLRDIFDAQSANPFSKFLKEKILKEVSTLDRQSIERRDDYFSEHFGISSGSQKDITKLKEIMEVRNRISHEIYASPPSTPEQVQDQALVSDKMLEYARQLFRSFPSKCIEIGAQTYQSYFGK